MRKRDRIRKKNFKRMDKMFKRIDAGRVERIAHALGLFVESSRTSILPVIARALPEGK